MNPLFKFSSILLLLAACVLITIVMRIQGKPLQTPTAPKGIVSLEFAYTAPTATLIKNEWSYTSYNNKSVLQVALNNTLIDFVYIGIYCLFLISVSLRSAQILKNKKLLQAAAALAFAAGAFDMIENFGMLYTLQKQAIPIITIATGFAAAIKFFLIAIVVLLILFCWGGKLFQKRQLL